MGSKPRIVDLFCGAGGAGKGYADAGFEVVGVDHVEQPDYPFAFHHGDALEFPLDGFDAVHASPPCQAYTAMSVMWNARTDHPELVDVIRERLIASGLPYVIENVPGAPMDNPVTICGSSLGLGVAKYGRELRRHRLFETNFPVMVAPCAHQRATIGIYGDHARNRRRTSGSRGIDFPDAEKLALGREAMGMPWVTRWKGLSQAIPPAYTEHIGGYLMSAVHASQAERSGALNRTLP